MGMGRNVTAQLYQSARFGSGVRNLLEGLPAYLWSLLGGTDYSSNATCLISPRLCSTAFITCLKRLTEFAAFFATFEDNLR